MANYSEREAEEAERIVRRLLAHQEVPVVEGSLVVSDIEFEANQFTAELRFLEKFHFGAPAVRVGEELVPVALPLIFGPFPLSLAERYLYESRRQGYFDPEDWMSAWIFRSGGPFRVLETLPLEDARLTFVRRATDFLATRISAMRDFEQRRPSSWGNVSYLNAEQRAGGPRVPTPGCQFKVSTNSSGLRVFWSGAYRISPNYFSHPTTPAVSVLQSGTYVFGVDGGAYGNQIQWDLNAVVALPGNPSVHLNY